MIEGGVVSVCHLLSDPGPRFIRCLSLGPRSVLLLAARCSLLAASWKRPASKGHINDDAVKTTLLSGCCRCPKCCIHYPMIFPLCSSTTVLIHLPQESSQTKSGQSIAICFDFYFWCRWRPMGPAAPSWIRRRGRCGRCGRCGAFLSFALLPPDPDVVCLAGSIFFLWYSPPSGPHLVDWLRAGWIFFGDVGCVQSPLGGRLVQGFFEGFSIRRWDRSWVGSLGGMWLFCLRDSYRFSGIFFGIFRDLFRDFSGFFGILDDFFGVSLTFFGISGWILEDSLGFLTFSELAVNCWRPLRDCWTIYRTGILRSSQNWSRFLEDSLRLVGGCFQTILQPRGILLWFTSAIFIHSDPSTNTKIYQRIFSKILKMASPINLI